MFKSVLLNLTLPVSVPKTYGCNSHFCLLTKNADLDIIAVSVKDLQVLTYLDLQASNSERGITGTDVKDLCLTQFLSFRQCRTCEYCVV